VDCVLAGDTTALIALTRGGDLAPLFEALDEYDREDTGELMFAALLRVASLEAAAAISFDPDEAAEHDPDEQLADEDAELPVDPWTDDSSPVASTLQRARLLREALLDQPDAPAMLAALGALSDAEYAEIVAELALSALLKRRLDDGADEADREDRGEE
jgi:hypothetical protein